MIINLRWLCTIISSPELTCLYSSRVIIPSLSVSCMLNKTAEKQTNAGLTLCHLQVKVKQSSSCDLYWDVHLSFSLLVFPRCSSVMCADGGLKWDMTTTNSSKPISWTFPSPFWWKFLKKTANHPKCKNCLWFWKIQVKWLKAMVNYCTFCQKTPLWSVRGWDWTLGRRFHWNDLSWGFKIDFQE